jgi:hypothetical protein
MNPVANASQSHVCLHREELAIPTPFESVPGERVAAGGRLAHRHVLARGSG